MFWYAFGLHFQRDIALKPTLFGLVVRDCLDNAEQLNRGHRDIVVKLIKNGGFHRDIALKPIENHQFHRDIASEPIEMEVFTGILLQNK